MKNKGFNLTELMIVIAIIGIIASFGLYSAGATNLKARISAEVFRVAANIKKDSVEDFQVLGTWPTSTIAYDTEVIGGIAVEDVSSLGANCPFPEDVGGIRFTIKSSFLNTAADGNLVLLATDNAGSITWHCVTDNTGTGSIAAAALPESCTVPTC